MVNLPIEPIAVALPPGFQSQFRLLRAADQLDIAIQLINLVPVRVGGAFRPQRNEPGKPSGIVLTLPPQHLLDSVSGKPSRRIVADPTKLVFIVGEGQDAIPLSTSGILAALPSLIPNGHHRKKTDPTLQLNREHTDESLPKFQSAYALVRAAMVQFIPDDRIDNRAVLPTHAYLEDLSQRAPFCAPCG
jgi:hypothetical protein